ncbi:protein takeout-like [Chrysoperla carnea]|uniref:protein takeout-like n=1 Tax=Chrysoperla carnea TaxID=189513 RepID=UPI001D06A967|nr:protein takeout-like [Chrysoperla carnea]
MFLRYIIFIIISNCFLFSENKFVLPRNIQRCNLTDSSLNACILKNAQDSLAMLKDGIPNFQILPMDPLFIERLAIPAKNGISAVKLTQEYRNVLLHGLSRSKILDLKIDIYNNYQLNITILTPVTYMTGDYHLAGKVLVLPIMGNGTFNITLINTKSFMNITSKIIKKPNIEYLHIIKCDLELYPEEIRMQFENLFNGDPTLGTQMNVFLNENSQTIFDELKEKKFELQGTPD